MDNMTFKKMLAVSSLGISMSMAAIYASAQEQATGLYFAQSFLGSELRASGARQGILLDDDLIRDNGDNEAVIAVSDNPLNTNPFQFFTSNRIRERVVSVFFNDGSSLDNVRSLTQFSIFNFGRSSSLYLVDQSALASVGKTLNDVSDIVSGELVEHDLNWSDFGFAIGEIPDSTGSADINFVTGTRFSERLVGTDDSDVINGLGGSRDRISGGPGDDFFVVGAEVNDGERNRDIILDFNPSEDTLVIENGAEISSATPRRNSLIIRFQGGDRDFVRLRNINNLSQVNILSLDGSFDPNTDI